MLNTLNESEKSMSQRRRRRGNANWLHKCASKTATALLLSATAAAGAQSGGGEDTGGRASGWTYELTPYLWGSGLKGTTRARNLPTTNIDTGFSDIFDVIDFAAMGTFEARLGRWGMLLDLMYLDLSDSGTSSRTGAGPVGATLTVDADVSIKQTMLAAAGLYRVSHTGNLIDLVGGLRYTDTDVDADIDRSLFGPGGAGAAARVSRSGSKDWVDPILGVRVQHPIADRWTLVGYADVGGFGVGSDLTWQAILGATYVNSNRFTLKFGYRYLSIDYDSGSFLYDATMQGPYFGVGIRF